MVLGLVGMAVFNALLSSSLTSALLQDGQYMRKLSDVSGAFFTPPSALLCSADSPRALRSFIHSSGTLCVQAGYPLLEQWVRESSDKPTSIVYNNIQTCMKMLQSGAVEAVISDRPVLAFYVQQGYAFPGATVADAMNQNPFVFVYNNSAVRRGEGGVGALACSSRSPPGQVGLGLRSIIDTAVIATVTDPTSGVPQLQNAFLNSAAAVPMSDLSVTLARWPQIVSAVLGALTLAETALLLTTTPEARARLSARAAELASRVGLRWVKRIEPSPKAAAREVSDDGACKDRAGGLLELARVAAPADEMRALLAILRDVSARLEALEARERGAAVDSHPEGCEDA